MPKREARPGLTLAFSTRSAGPHIGRYVRHLRRSCGVARVEILYRVNPGKVSLAELYNDFLAQASHDVVVLLHDDLRFARGSAWGRRLLGAFAAHPDYAVLGPAGSVSLEKHGIWWQPLQEAAGQVDHLLEGRRISNRYSEAFDQPLDVLVLDGLLLGVHRQRVKTRFDPRIPGFHFYDLAFSLAQSLAHQRGEGGKCGVLTGLGVTHRSGGDMGAAFETARREFLEIYGSVLPRSLRPQLKLGTLPQRAHGPSVLALVWYRDEKLAIGPLLQGLQTSIYKNGEIVCINSTNKPLPEGLKTIPAPGIQTWSDLNEVLMRQVSQTRADLILLLDNRVLPLQDWLPAMVSDFVAHADLGTLGVRLHYPDTHLIAHNGLELFQHENGQPDVAIRGIHSPYGYRNALEWVPSGSMVAPLMLRREDFLACGGLAGQAWLPGLELNLGLRGAGRRNAVDSRLVGYRLAEDEGTEKEYHRFLAYFALWMKRMARQGDSL